ncbi:MAG: CPBP family intramembrane metalloprotease, partial [Oscillospiraceae bacterium]|nr:CPBP family intramembrane metalloprotease [Oscillospiraceae bacterium]
MVKRGVKTIAPSGRERTLGGVLLVCSMVVFPVIAGRVFDFAEYMLETVIGKDLRDAVYYYVLFALTLVTFGNFWKRTTRALFSDVGRTLSSLGLGLIAFYGLNDLSARLLRLLPLRLANLNDATISARLGASPGSTILIVVFLAPVVEETLFRGYVFGLARERSRTAAYTASCLLWALAHVWQYAAGDWSYLLMAAQYIVPGLVMAWTYERAGSLWGSVLLHGMV